MKRQGSEYAIDCDPRKGPIFGDRYNSDIYIYNSCFITNDGTRGFECHPEYRSSLFVNTAGPDEENKFSVVDYEVYTYK